MVSEIRKKRFSNRYRCPHCSNRKVVRYGTYHGRQLMLGGAALAQTAQKLSINIATAFGWRPNMLSILKNLEDDAPSGIVEADDTFFSPLTEGKQKQKT